MVVKAFRFQLRTRPEVEQRLRRFTGSCRWVWNAAIAEQQRQREAGEKFAGHAAMCRWLTEWRHAPDTAWLAETPIHPLQQTLRRLEAAYQRFFAAEGGYPRFKRRGQEPGLRFPDPRQFALDQGNARVKLPKLGWLRMRQSQPLAGELRNASVTAERGRWFVSLQVQLPDVMPSADVQPTLGVDLGVALFAAMSDGRTVEPLNALKKQQRRLKHAQRAVSRKVKGSRNRRKAVDRLGRLHARIAAQRNDWLHKLSTELADQHPVIAIEDLKVAAMSASAAGTAQAPGKGVRQKAGLNRAILDQGWAEFRRQLEYKCAARGGAVVPVNPAYTSQTCSRCGCVDKANRRAQALFACLACGHTENADANAAHNILAAGRVVWAARPAACASGGQPRQARKGPACSRDEAGTHRGDPGCSSRGAVGIPVPSGLGGRQGQVSCFDGRFFVL
jgi:putative transposase